MALAHAKWFVDNPEGFPTDLGFAFAPSTVALVVGAVAVAVVWRIVALRLGTPELSMLQPLGRLAPWIPRLLGIHLGVALVGLAVTNTYLSPALSLDPVPGGWAVAFLEGLVGVWLVSGWRLRWAALGVVLLGPIGLLLAGPVPVLEALDLLGIALFLAWLPPGPDAYGARPVTGAQLVAPMFVLRLCVGLTLIVVAYTEKLLHPELTGQFLERYPAFDLFGLVGLDVGADAFIAFAAAVEILFGLLIISGAAPQVAVIAAGIPFNATLFFMGRSELIGHLPIYGAMLALLVYGSVPGLAESVRDLNPFTRPRPRAVAADPVGARRA